MDGEGVNVLLLEAAQNGAAVEDGEHGWREEPSHDGRQEVTIDKGLKNKFVYYYLL